MMHRVRTSLFAIALTLAAAGTAPAAFGQAAAPPAGQDHRAHHPDAAAPAKPDAPAAPQAQQGEKPMSGPMGMMCGEMKQDMKSLKGMMHDMMGMMGRHGAMMPPPADGALAALRAELKLTDAQAPLWERFAQVWRSAATMMKGQHAAMMAAGDGTLPARLARREAALASHLSSVRSIEEALAPLYASLSDEQKRTVDRSITFPMGMM